MKLLSVLRVLSGVDNAMNVVKINSFYREDRQHTRTGIYDICKRESACIYHINASASDESHR